MAFRAQLAKEKEAAHKIGAVSKGLAQREVNRLQQTLEIHTDLHRANSRPK
jgi:hypothetical protein